MNAQWKIDEGRTVDLRLAGDGFERVHPFKRFQKKRAGRVGTRFHMTCADVNTGEVIFNGEVMLAGWNDTSFQGQTIKLWLDEESTRHPFAGYIRRSGKVVGSIFQSVLVEVNDDNAPVDQHAEKELDAAHGKKKKAFSSSAHLMVTSPKFVQYLIETQAISGRIDPEYAKRWVKWRIGIESLSDLDRDAAALKRFREVIQRPFARWNGEDY